MQKIINTILIIVFFTGLLVSPINKPVPITKAAVSPVPNPGIVGFFPDVGTVRDVVVSADGSKAYLASEQFGLVIVDITNSQAPKVISSQRPKSEAGHIVLSSDEKLAIITGAPLGTELIDISNPLYPKSLSSIPGSSSDAVISGHYAYIIAAGDLKVVDISVPSAPIIVATLATPNVSMGVALSGNTAVVADSTSGLQVVDITNPLAPRITGSVSLGGNAYRVAITSHYAVVANSSFGSLQVVDFANPSAPSLVATLRTGSALSVDVEGNLAAVGANMYGIRIVDITNPTAPSILGTYDMSDGQFNVSGAAIEGQTVYIAGNEMGLVTIDISTPASPTLIIALTNEHKANHVALSEDGRLAVVTGTPRGTEIVDVSDPYDPEVLASVPGGSSDAVIAGRYAYLVAGGDLKVVDIAAPSAPSVVATLVTPNTSLGVALSGNTAVVADSTSGLQVVDITNPLAPRITGTVSLGGVAYRVAITSHYAVVANSSFGSLQVVDFANPSAPSLVATLRTGSALSVDVEGNLAAVGANMYGIRIVDITNPTAPSILGTYDMSDGLFNVSGAAIEGQTVYIAGNEMGLVTIDISTPASPTLIISSSSIGSLQDVVFLNNKLYAADSEAELVIFDAFSDKITVAKSADKYTVSSGDEVTYTLTATNTSPNTLTNLNLSDPIPTGTSYVAGSATGGGVYDAGQNKVIWTIASIPPSGQAGSSVTYTFKVKVQ